MGNGIQTEQIAEEYREATLTHAWHGPSLAKLLADTTPELATVRPLPNAHSVSELLQHLLLWNERIRNTTLTNPLPKWDAEKEWAESPIPWNELLERWKQSRDLLEKRLRNFPVEDLPKQVPGRTYPFETMLRGSTGHVAYHAGQIAMILSMLRKKA